MTGAPTNRLMSAEEVRRQDIANSQPLPAAIDKGKARLSDPMKVDRLRDVLVDAQLLLVGAISGFAPGSETHRMWAAKHQSVMSSIRKALKETV